MTNELIIDDRDFELTPEEELQRAEQAKKNLRKFFAEREAENAIDETRFSDSVYEI